MSRVVASDFGLECSVIVDVDFPYGDGEIFLTLSVLSGGVFGLAYLGEDGITQRAKEILIELDLTLFVEPADADRFVPVAILFPAQ